uniref:Uncharacterized protein n=1 Tax=Amphilophus citrinellus TaxID=61819 RepID=A0A3Q0RN31_AMPCI
MRCTFILYLSVFSELLTKDYSETYYQEDGTRVTTVPKDIDHCYYHGRIVNDSRSSVSISTCNGLRGYFRTSAQRYLIEPLSSDDEGDHAVTTFNPKNFTPAVCGVTNTSWSDDFEPPMGRGRSRSAVTQLVLSSSQAQTHALRSFHIVLRFLSIKHKISVNFHIDGRCSTQISPTTRECRMKQDDCDLAEYCDGKSPTCPEDVFAVNGLPCDGGLGYCYNGQCPQRTKQCVKMYGSKAGQSCYNYNTRGTYYAFCRRPSKDQFIPCQQEDVLCGKLFCSSSNDDPNYDYSLVETGTKCGDGKVCSQSQCVDLQTAYRNTNCSANCPGHAVST